MNDLHYLVYLHTIGVSHKKLHFLFAEEQNYKECFENLETLSRKGVFENPAQQAKILQAKKDLNTTELLESLQKHDIKIVSYYDKNYPSLLRQLVSPPYLLYVQGNIDDSPKLAVVGSRKMSEYGQKVIQKIVPSLCKYFTIVSGGAFGCDTQAHLTTLENDGKTIAVIGTGIDITYPAENKTLYTKIVEGGGAIVSVFPVGTPGSNYTFPIRNEIIAGISNGVLIAEAAEKSGTLITARLALDQARDVFAVPGDMFRLNSFGCLDLIKKGEAKLITCAQDVLEEYNIILKTQVVEKPLSFSDELEKEVFECLVTDSKTIDEIALHLGKPISAVVVKMSFLELSGRVSKAGNGKYQIH